MHGEASGSWQSFVFRLSCPLKGCSPCNNLLRYRFVLRSFQVLRFYFPIIFFFNGMQAPVPPPPEFLLWFERKIWVIWLKREEWG